VTGLGAALSRAWPAFPESEFVDLAASGLKQLELKARVSHVSDGLVATMPEDFRSAAAVVRAAIGAPGFDDWIVFPVNDWVARAGLDDPDTAVPLLGELTALWSAEFAIRPFIETHRRRTFEEFDLWIRSPDEHRRRLVSEGSRPRLPWGRRLREFIDDPTPTIALLDRLVDDPSAYVRKSVANHLNDISKDHPRLAVDTAARWLAGPEDSPSSRASAQPGDPGRRKWIVSHGLRSLVKQGDPAALRLLGFDPDAEVSVTTFSVTPPRIAVGDAVTISFALVAEQATPVMVDYRIHHAGASGARSPKVFKLKRTVIEPGVETAFRREHRIREVSVRRIHPGPHVSESQVNGKVLGAATVEVTRP
jgi:3-methyladenine DNA glycosylase AlkC